MKDPLGHGSNGRGGSSVVVQNGSSSRGVMPARPFRESQGPVTSNAEAAASLMSTLKSTQSPVHSAMASSRDTDPFGRPRSDESKAEYDEYNRDLALRSRNGQVGSGMKFRG